MLESDNILKAQFRRNLSHDLYKALSPKEYQEIRQILGNGSAARSLISEQRLE